MTIKPSFFNRQFDDPIKVWNFEERFEKTMALVGLVVIAFVTVKSLVL